MKQQGNQESNSYDTYFDI